MLIDRCLQVLLENTPVPLALLDKEGIITRCNDAFLLLVDDENIANVTGKPLYDFVNEKHHESIKSVATRNLQGTLEEEIAPIALEVATEDPRTATLYLTLLHTNHEIGDCFAAHMINTTEAKTLEVKYAHSQKMQAVGQLAGGIAHDFNNLLTAMIGFCDLLLMRHPAGDQSFADIMQIKQNANRAANLVRQLLAFSRRQTLQPKLFDVTDILAELSNLISRLIGESIELKMQHGRDLGMIKVDQGQLEQVIVNLAVNARDAMQDGGLLTIETHHATIDKRHPIPRNYYSPAEDEPIPDGDYVVIDITDTGTGIPTEILEQIFEPFFSTKEIGAGTGLGLATVYGIIKQTGGFVFVSTREGQGTTFHIYLPQFETDESAHEGDDPNKEESAHLADLTGKATILLVEDEAPVRAFSARALSNKGYTVLEADCAEAALEIFEEHTDSIDLIISDVIMPGKSGPDMVSEIYAKHPNIKVIFISGYAEDDFLRQLGSDHNFQFLPKPYTLKQLATKVKEVSSQE